ncbi:MAG: hypothetical protein J6Z00_04160, partial [Clostridia bacterium]|nr:hypothetical protein [Clostridia bacterium]
MKRTLAIVTCILLVASLAAVPTSAVSRKYNSPLSQYTTQDAVKGQAGTILYETFDSAKDANATGFFATYEEEVKHKGEPDEIEYRIPTCNVKISTEKAHSGKSSLKVYNRKAVNRTDNGEHTFICTNLYYKLDTQAYASQKFTDGNGKASKAYKFDYGKNIAKVDLGKKITANYKGDKASRDGKAT